MVFRIGFLMVALFAVPQSFAGDISGLWKHADEPGWIEIDLEQGNGTVVRNDRFPERVGREIVKDLTADESAENQWLGQVYVQRLGEYKDAEISLPEPDRMQFKVKVGFVSRTVSWSRVDSIEAE